MKKSLSFIRLFCIVMLFSSCATTSTDVLLNDIAPTLSTSKKDYLPHSKKKFEVVLVLGAGGARGVAHAGVLEVFSEENIPLDLIIGCSSGSIAGSLYADYKDARKVRNVMLHIKKSDILGINVIGSKMGLSNGKKLLEFLSHSLKSRYFSHLKIPFWAVTTNLVTGKLEVFRQGPLVPAVAASSAYPFVFQPVSMGKKLYVDGGVSEPIPAELAKQTGAKIVIAVDISAELPRELPQNLFGVAKRCAEIGYLTKSKKSREYADIVISPKLGSIGTFSDGYNVDSFFAGKKAARKMIPEIKKLLLKNNISLEESSSKNRTL